MSEARQFLIEDISALLNPNKTHEWLNMVNDSALYGLWQDLVRMTKSEDIE